MRLANKSKPALICVNRRSSVAISLLRASASLRFIMVLMLLIAADAKATVTSALINKQLDSLQNLKLDSTLPDAMQQIGNQTGVRLEADPAVWDLLPWGEQTEIKANIQNRTPSPRPVGHHTKTRARI